MYRINKPILRQLRCSFGLTEGTVHPGLKIFGMLLIFLFVSHSPAWVADFRDLQVSVKNLKPFKYICYQFVGPYSEFPRVREAFRWEFRNSRISPTGNEIAIFWNSPLKERPENLRWDIGYPVSSDQKDAGNMIVKEFNYSRGASTIHRGSYLYTYQTIRALYQWIAINGYAPIGGPCVEVYYDEYPENVPDAEKTTEILIPIE